MFVLGAVGLANAAETDWKVGVARVKITPDQPVLLAGYASRTHPFEHVAADLFAKALALEDKSGHLAVLVTTDLIGLTAAVAEPVCEKITAKTGLKRAQILFNSSHIHTGPTLAPIQRRQLEELPRAIDNARWLTLDIYRTSSSNLSWLRWQSESRLR